MRGGFRPKSQACGDPENSRASIIQRQRRKVIKANPFSPEEWLERVGAPANQDRASIESATRERQTRHLQTPMTN